MVVNRARILLGIAEQAGRVRGHTDPVRLFPSGGLCRVFGNSEMSPWASPTSPGDGRESGTDLSRHSRADGRVFDGKARSRFGRPVG